MSETNSTVSRIVDVFKPKNIFYITSTKSQNPLIKIDNYQSESTNVYKLLENQDPFSTVSAVVSADNAQASAHGAIEEASETLFQTNVVFVENQSVLLDALPYLDDLTASHFIVYLQDKSPLSLLLEDYFVYNTQKEAAAPNGFQILATFPSFNELPIEKIFEEIIVNSNNEINNLFYSSASVSENNEKILNVLKLEDCYYKVLKQIFDKSNLEILNNYQDVSVKNYSPEYGFGKFLKIQENKKQIFEILKTQYLNNSKYNVDLIAKYVNILSENEKQDFSQTNLVEYNKLAHEFYEYLVSIDDSNVLQRFANVEDYLFKSYWLIGSDAWSYDLGNSGIHHVLASNCNINVLIIDSEPQSEINKNNAVQRKKDIGLYAMNLHNSYVSSVAAYGSYIQLLASIDEASKFDGPSIVLAYLPYSNESQSPLEVLKETKKAIETGYWPLYSYDPSIEDEEKSFKLFSSVIKKNLQDFLDKENKLTLLAKEHPDFARNLAKSASQQVDQKLQNNASSAFEKLLEGLSGPPLTVFFASDGGNAASLAKRLATRATARGLKSSAYSMDDINLEELNGLGNVVFISSTAGQGEFPQDGKAFWDAIKSSTDLDLASLKFSVFGLGDSKYWPRSEDAHYYNKPAQDLYKKLVLFAAQPLVELGLGDDQDADGYQTGYQIWEQKLWEVLNVANADVPDEPKPITNEDMKIASDFLRGTIVEGLQDESTGAVSASDQQMTKFHGIYMQDDRDIRDVRKSQGLEPYYSFMSRVRLPGGIANPDQWLILDRLADESGNGTIKITTRATFQLHGIIKKNLKHAIRGMNSTLMDTVAACGDVNRNVMVSALPHNAKVHKQVSDMGALISEHLLPQTTAYHEIWLEGPDEQDYDSSWPSIFENRKEGPKKKKTMVSGNALVDYEPMYGPTYLPRKFKVNITVPPYNDVDVFSSDVGLVAIVDPKTQIVTGYNLYVGGGMGTTHNNTKTYPRTGSSFGFIKPEDVPVAIEKVMLVQRDFGDRTNRKHARLKYTIDDMGIDVYKQKVEELWGKEFAPEQSYEITSNIDYFGWVKDENGLNHFTCFIENGRVEDTPDLPQKTGFKKICQYMNKVQSGHFRLTGNQHVLICGIEDQHLEDIKSLMAKYKLDNTSFSGLRLSSAACVALPTCGLAMAESERYLPVLISKLEEALEEYGLRHDSVVMRMTGCPNGCARPWLAEVACVGKAPGTYNLMLGGGYYGQRINKLYRSSIKEEEILETLKALFKRWSLEREDGEHFGDFCIRIGEIKPTLEGKYFHDDIDENAL